MFHQFSGFAIYPHLFADRHPPPYVPISDTFPKYPMYLDQESEKFKSHFKEIKNQHDNVKFKPSPLNLIHRDPKNFKTNSHFHVHSSQFQNQGNLNSGSKDLNSGFKSSYAFYPGQKMRNVIIRRRSRRRKYGDVF